MMYATGSVGKTVKKKSNINQSSALQCEENENEERPSSPKINRESGREIINNPKLQAPGKEAPLYNLENS